MIDHLLVFNLATDQDDPILAFACDWLARLAHNVETVDVITMREGRYDLPSNVSVYSVGKEAGYSEPRRGLRFYRILADRLREQRYDGCFAHMMPVFLALGSPLLARARVPTILWYAHRNVRLSLRYALKAANLVISPTASSFPLATEKLHVTGHGIDTHRFRPFRTSKNVSSSRILTVGRLTAEKNVVECVRALACLRDDHGIVASLDVIGPVYQQADCDYAEEVREALVELDLRDEVNLRGAVPYSEMPIEYKGADLAINLSATGSLDKTMLEAMSCGVPVITSNQSGIDFLRANSLQDLGVDLDPAKIASTAARTLGTRDRRLNERVRELVVSYHDLDRLMECVLALFAELKSKR